MKSISAAAIALSLVLGSLTTAHADGRDQDRHEHRHFDDRDHHDRDRDHDRRDHRRDDHDYGKRDWDKSDHSDRDYRRGYWQGRYDGGRYIRPKGYYQHSWRRGERLPAAFYSKRYVVRDYGAYRLKAPPRGYHWVRVERDVLLTAVATGVVVSVVNGLFH